MLCTLKLVVLCYWTSFIFLWKVELNEIESRCEEYPLTRAFCQLISTLVESSFPSNLGAGLRPPGFDPYLQFLRDSVFLRFRTRAYRRAAEKVMFREKLLSPYLFYCCFFFFRGMRCYKFILAFESKIYGLILTYSWSDWFKCIKKYIQALKSEHWLFSDQ